MYLVFMPHVSYPSAQFSALSSIESKVEFVKCLVLNIASFELKYAIE